jgi:CubicO group peptidase (beta-lactamase class C family)
MRSPSHIVLLLLLIGWPGSAQDMASNNRVRTVDSIALNKKIDSLFVVYTNDTSPGCAITVFDNGKVLAKRAFGTSSIEHTVPFTHSTVVRIPYSEAREFISIAAVLMENDGLLKLNDKVRTYFPLLPAWAEAVTLWDLLNHGSGFVDEWATLLLSQNSMSNRFETSQFLKLLYTQPEPEIEPGKGYMYSNSDFGLLRLIMEKASGKTLPEFMKQRVFDPLTMSDSQMQNSPLDVVARKADMYQRSGAESYVHGNVQKTSPGGNYFILASADDLERWATAMNDPSSEVHKAAGLLLRNVRTIPGKENHHINGYTVNTIKNFEVIRHEGVNGYNYLTRVPSKGLAVVTLGNIDGDGFSAENKAIVDYLMKVPPPIYPKLKTKRVSIAKEALKKYEGNYRWLGQVSWEGPLQTREFSIFFVADGKLKVKYTGDYVIELIPVGKDVFYYNEGFGLQLEFKQSTPGAPLRVVATFDDGFPGVTMERDESTSWRPSKEMLAGFTGRYHSKHLDYYWNFELDAAGELWLKRANLPDIKVEPDGLNQFHHLVEKYPGVASDSWILFDKDNQGRVTGFMVWSGRVMHHRFLIVH